MSYMTAGKLQAFEALMMEVPGHNHYDSGCDGNQTALTFELTHAFIKAIYVHDADNIEILWKFRDIYEETEGKK